MAEDGSIGRWPVVGDKAGYTAGISCFTAARQRVRAFPLRSWADVWSKKVAKGDVVVVRVADDLVVSFRHRTEAERFLKYRIDGRLKEISSRNDLRVRFQALVLDILWRMCSADPSPRRIPGEVCP